MGDGEEETRPHHRSLRSRMRQAIIFKSRWGWIGISERTKGIDALVLPKASRQAVLSELGLSEAKLVKNQKSSRLQKAQTQLASYLAGTRRSFDLPLDISQGTMFQQKVWQVLRRISYGRLRSYRWVAIRVGGKQYARAVGNAVGANPIPIVIPCHRIVAHDASLGGFSGGLPTKRKLLTLEGTLAELRSRRQ
ncbi:MAG: methylated-DNA--[protein]-cysteine S-methyltransferase [Nitrospira sp. CG24E]|nr:MAG: methylated-DNA--[protein]-cysteine S-methyltransferase [Nitrospira sp. CG24E]